MWRYKIEEILTTHPCYGYRRITKELKRRDIRINKKKIQRIMKKYGLTQRKKRRKWNTTNSNHTLPTYPNLIQGVIPSFPDHIWAGDITYIRLDKDFCYLAAIIDVFTRSIRSWTLGTTLEAMLTVNTLQNALSRHTSPEYHHSDRGSQYCAHAYTDILKENKVKISMSKKGTPTDNPHIESFFRTLKVEEVYMWEYDTIETAKSRISEFIDTIYAKKRLHSSLGYLPPEEFEAEWNKSKGRDNIIPIQKTEKNTIFAVS
jgi:putative transposase